MSTVVLNLQDAITLVITAPFVGVDGKSAYQIALQNGFVGTEPQWLASLANAYSESVATSREAGTVLIAYKLITTDTLGKAIYADAATIGHAGRLIGIALQAAGTVGDIISIVTEGLVVNAGWTWTPGDILYVGLAGDIVNTQVGLYATPIGYAVSATSIFLNKGSTIIRS